MKRIRSSITAQATATFAVVSAVVVAGFAVMTITAGNLKSADHQRSGSTRALVAANGLEQSVLDLETGLRGYLLAGSPDFLQPYQQALARYPALVRSLDVATAGDPAAHKLSLWIGTAVHDYVAHWTGPVIQTARTNLAAARRAEAGGAGKQRVDAMRTRFAALLTQQPPAHIEQFSRASALANLVLILGIGATLLFLAVVIFMALRTQSRLVAP